MAAATGTGSDGARARSRARRRPWCFSPAETVVAVGGGVALVGVMVRGCSPGPVAVVCLGTAALLLLVAVARSHTAPVARRDRADRARRARSSPPGGS